MNHVNLRFRKLNQKRIHGFAALVAKEGTIARILRFAGISRRNCPEGLLIENTNRANTIGNRFDVDLLFFDENWKPLIAVRQAPPHRRCRVPEAKHLLILPSDWDVDRWNDEVVS